MNFELNIKDTFGKEFQFNNRQEIRSFLNLEKEYWLAKRKEIGKNLSGSFPGFPEQAEQFLAHFDLYEKAVLLEPQPDNLAQLKHNYEGAKTQFIQWCVQYWIYRGNAHTEALLDAYKYSNESGVAFWNAIKNHRVENNNQRFDSFAGIMMAYEFLFQNESFLNKRRYTEKRTFITLRNELEDERNKQISNFAEFNEEYSKWYENLQGSINDWFKNCRERSESTINNHSTFFNQMTEHAIERHKELENLYAEKLRLEKPAKYWEVRANKLKIQGIIWSFLLVVVLLIGIGYFTLLFKYWLTGQQISISLHSLQGAVLLTVIISTFIFCIRVLSRLIFSSFHLQRDAEERQQLAYVYLALSNETKVDEESRKIILQALFSRAETGLLASESGPTMPAVDGITGLVSKINK
ncbi:DUF6161 domain-containing protein [Acinetobacter baumannii]|nr:DUF6161 domain-containing protein [Acinetobacter baumannii]MDC5298392.1 DUF6161 domain-containing protein [Acinetobacter baumannii]MDN8343063.1 DUF6161 domain-containing protein [Acinetobacter baumannii]HCA5310672.1 hypothetical protein [Acinetobacter baumannii]HEN9538376.1 hypothetical protein [Acinetobacter baumannii]